MSRVVVITGASRGIGEELAYEFAKRDSALALTFHREEGRVAEVVKHCLALDAPQAFALRLNLSDEGSIRECAQKIMAKFERIDILVNNAGILVSGKLSEQSFEEIDQQVNVSLLGPLKFTSLLLPAVQEAVINVGSNLSRLGKKNLAAYCSAKFGIRGMTQALAKEWPALRILALHPPLTNSGMGGGKGANPRTVASVIYRAAIGEIGKVSGSDVWIEDYLPGFWRYTKKILRRFFSIK